MCIVYHCKYAKEVPGVKRFLCARKMKEGKDYSANLAEAISVMCPNQDFCECKKKPELLYSSQACLIAAEKEESSETKTQNEPMDYKTSGKRKKKGEKT